MKIETNDDPLNNAKMANQSQEIVEKLREAEREKLEIEGKLQEKIAEIKRLTLEIWDSCPHKWVRDSDVSWDDSCKWFCSECSLWKDRGIYT